MNTLLQINSVVNYGSTGRIAEGIGISAINQEWNSYIAFGRKGGQSESRLINIGSPLELHLHVLATRLFDRHGFASYIATRHLINRIEEIKPDIIHLHNLHGYYLNIKLLCNYLANKDFALVWTLHDCWPVTGHCTNFESVKCLRWIDGCHDCPQKKIYPASYLLDQSRRNFNEKKMLFTSLKKLTIISVSKWLSGIIERSFLSKYPLEIINNGIDMDIFKPDHSSGLIKNYNPEKKFIILGVASKWTRNKGFYDFLELGRRLGPDYQIIMLGMNAFQISCLPRNIIGVPRTNDSRELAEFYSFADVFINPTYEDTFSTTNLEAMACGTPVISYETGGSTESVLPETGMIVQKGDIQGLINAIETFRSVGKSFYSPKCYNHARLHYNKNDRYSEYIRLYYRILSHQVL